MIRIFRILVPTSVLALILSEILLIYGCYTLAAYVTLDVEADLFFFNDSGFLKIGVTTAVIVLGLYFSNQYNELRIRSRIRLIQQLCGVIGAAFLIQALMSYADRDWTMPRRAMFAGSAMTVVVVFCWRLLFQLAIQNALGSRRLLFVGMSPVVQQLSRHFQLHPELGFSPIGYLDGYSNHLPAPDGLPCLGSATDVVGAVDEHHPHWLVIGNRDEIQPSWADQLLELRFGGVETQDAASLYEATFGRVCAEEIRPEDLVFENGFQPGSVRLNLQSLYSTTIGAIVLLLAFPWMLLIALIIRLTTSGPVLKREQCVGLNDRPFTRYRFNCTKDGRWTTIGRILRETRFEALPQILNVVAGHMSLVGPQVDRIELSERLKSLVPFYGHRYTVKPGLTGWEQIQPDPQTLDVVRRLEYDLYYVKNLSPSLDLFVLLRSPKATLSPR
jgi:lipopolysaccharide/colanic/teichoic acid biosynthesis glycosyltransferase